MSNELKRCAKCLAYGTWEGEHNCPPYMLAMMKNAQPFPKPSKNNCKICEIGEEVLTTPHSNHFSQSDNMVTPQEEDWEKWVRVLSNSKNPHDTDLLIAKIHVLLQNQVSLRLERISNLCRWVKEEGDENEENAPRYIDFSEVVQIIRDISNQK